MLVGILAFQGTVLEHMNVINSLSVATLMVKSEADLLRCDALIIPGGESTTMSLLLTQCNMFEPIREFIKNHIVWGTCAGMILLSNHGNKLRPDQQLIGGLDITITRNAFGTQKDSFTQMLDIVSLDKPFLGIFIRAPVVEIIESSGVEVICKIERGVVGVKQGNVIGTSFHPELTNDKRFHEYFLSLVRQSLLEDLKNISISA